MSKDAAVRPKEGDLVSREAVCSLRQGEDRSAPGGGWGRRAHALHGFPLTSRDENDIPVPERGAEPRSRSAVLLDDVTDLPVT